MADRRVRLVLEAQVNDFKRGMDEAAKSTDDVRDSVNRLGTYTDQSVSKSSAALNRMSGGVSGVSDEMRKAVGSADRLGSGMDGLATSFASGLDMSLGFTDVLRAMGSVAADPIREIGREWSNASRTMQSEMQTVGTGFAALGGAILGVGSSLMTVGISYNSLQQSAGQALSVMTDSASDAAAQMDRLNDFVSTSPFFRDTWLRAQQQLMAFGLEAENVVPTLEGVQEAVAAIGGGDAEIMRLVDILGQIQGQGQITGRELQRMGQMGIDAASIMGDQMGMTGDEIRTQITTGAIDAETAIEALTTGMAERFEGSADAIRDTMGGAWADLQAAWRDLGSVLAAPLVDPEGGGGLVWMTNAAADLLRAIQRLPDPVLQTVGAMSGLAGAGMAAYGMLLFAVPKLVEFREAKERLATVMPKTNKAIGTFNSAMGVTVGIIGSLQIASMMVDWFRDGGYAARDLERELNNLNDSGGNAQNALAGLEMASSANFGFGGLAHDMSDMGTAMDQLVPSWSNLGGSMNWLSGQARDARDSWEAMDEAMASLTQGGNVEQSTSQMQELAQSALDGGYSLEQIADFMPEYVAALNDFINQNDLAVDRTELLQWAFEGVEPEAVKAAGGVDGVAEAAEEEARAAEEAARANEELDKALEELGVTTDGTIESLQNFMDVLFEAGLLTQSVMEAEAAFEAQLDSVDESVKQLTDSLAEDYIQKGYSEQAARDLAREQIELGHVLDDNKDSFDLTTEAGREAQDQFFGVADSGRDMARAMAENDASQSEVQGALRQTYDNLVETARGFGMTTEDAEALTNEVLGIPDGADIDSWMSDEAKRVAEETREAVLSVDGIHTSSSHQHTVTNTENRVINTVRNFTERLFKADGGAVDRFSSGGSVFGPGGPRDDRIPAMLSNGEHVLTARDVQAMGGQHGVYQFRHDLHNRPSGRDMVPAYAVGGAVPRGGGGGVATVEAPVTVQVSMAGALVGSREIARHLADDMSAAIQSKVINRRAKA